MPNYHTITTVLRMSCLIIILITVSGCDYFKKLIENVTQKTEKTQQNIPLTLAVAPRVGWMPWYLAAEENIFKDYLQKYKIDIQFVSGDYQETIDKFAKGDVQAITITNIDAIGQLVKQGIETDAILIMSYSNGNEAILLPPTADTNVLKLRGKTFALTKDSTGHYLLDRYLIRNQIPFDDVTIHDTPETDTVNAFQDPDNYGIVTTRPTIDKLVHDQHAKNLFDSRAIPKEILDLLIINRETLRNHPNFAQALLATWFSIMERLQGNKRGGTLDAMARLANITREDFDKHIDSIILNDTPTKALSAIRDRKLTNTMRHVRYFMERHGLAGDEPFSGWVSYPGRTPGILHFNGQALQAYVAPSKNK